MHLPPNLGPVLYRSSRPFRPDSKRYTGGDFNGWLGDEGINRLPNQLNSNVVCRSPLQSWGSWMAGGFEPSHESGGS